MILVLLGLAAALVAPTLRDAAPAPDEFEAVVTRSRELAVRRAQTLLLDIDAQGNWLLAPAGNAAAIGKGTVQATAARDPLRIRITPLGACFAEGAELPQNWDAIACGRGRSDSR